MPEPATQDRLFDEARQHFLDGVSAIAAEDWRMAEAALRLSLACLPGRTSTLVNLSAALLKLEKLEEAAGVIEQLLSLDPGNEEARLNQGILFFERKQFDQALARFDALIADHPHNAHAFINRAITLDALGRADAALADLDHALALTPNSALAYVCRARVLGRLEQWQAALASVDKALHIQPQSAQANLVKGNVLAALKQYEQALVSLENAAAPGADNAEAHCRCANMLARLHRWPAAIERYTKALGIDSRRVDALVNRGEALEQIGNANAAEADYRQAIAIDATYVPGHIDLGNLQRKNRKPDLAVQSYQTAHDIDPHTPFLKGRLLHAKMLACDWRGLDTLHSAIDLGVQGGEKVVDPFAYQAIGESEALLGACARIFSDHWFPARYQGIPRSRKKEKIHVGYLCGEFREQATSVLMARVYELHDKDRFRIVALDNGYDDGSELRRRLSAAFDEWVDISGLGDAQVFAEIQRRDIDILVNLNGFFGLARPELFAMRPCPIQVNYLGFPGTIGASYIDYLLADETVIPPPNRDYYVEKIIYLPHSYQANDNTRAMSSRHFTRSELGLPDAGFVFCCFNNNYKITPDTFDGWMRILKQVPGSVLWLYENNPAASRNLRHQAAQRGIDAGRLIVAEDLPLPEHLARHALADLFLDTLPYNAHTTASDSLWAGLPLLTCTGSSFPGRVASSLLKAMGLPELITGSQQQYEDKAVWLAQHPHALREIREKLARQRAQSPLFDSARFTRHLEHAYRVMMERHHAGLAPQAFAVPDKAAANR